MGREKTHATDHQRQKRKEKEGEKKEKIFFLHFRNFLVQQMTEITIYWKRYYRKS